MPLLDSWVAQALACVLSFYLTNVVLRVGRASVCHEGAEGRLRDEHLKQPSCTRDEGGPLGIGRQGQIPSHFKLLRRRRGGGER